MVENIFNVFTEIDFHKLINPEKYWLNCVTKSTSILKFSFEKYNKIFTEESVYIYMYLSNVNIYIHI